MNPSTEQERLQRILRGQVEFMDQVHDLLAEEQKRDDILRAMVLSSRKEKIVKIEEPDTDRVFHLSTIKALCIKYRLRFLDAGLFKGEIPSQAILGIRQLERRTNGPLQSYKIMAPAERFKLGDCEVDPLLFVPMGNDNYYLVHKWGKDISWTRELRGWSVRTPVHLGATVLVAAALITLMFSSEALAAWGVPRLFLFFWTSTVLISFTVFGWLAFFGQFSSHAWNSRYFN